MTSAPVEIKIDRREQTLTLLWPDGGTHALDAALLRRACPCAECRLTRLMGGHIHVAARTEIGKLEPMGYGVQIGFSDGHARGIYPWSYLSSLAVESIP